MSIMKLVRLTLFVTALPTGIRLIMPMSVSLVRSCCSLNINLTKSYESSMLKSSSIDLNKQ